MNLYSLIKNEAFWLVDQVHIEGIAEEEYKTEFDQLLSEYSDGDRAYLSLLMEEAYEGWLFAKGFRKISVIHEYEKALEREGEDYSEISYHSLAEGLMTDSEFAQLYETCRSGSANKSIPQPIEQVMRSLRDELGEGWRNNCFYFRQAGEVMGISIPHIEKGTKDEGRIFYFGIVPAMRGKGLGAKIHKITLQLMLKMDINHYVGSTDESNAYMLNIFKRNGCQLKSKKGIYRIGK